MYCTTITNLLHRRRRYLLVLNYTHTVYHILQCRPIVHLNTSVLIKPSSAGMWHKSMQTYWSNCLETAKWNDCRTFTECTFRCQLVSLLQKLSFKRLAMWEWIIHPIYAALSNTRLCLSYIWPAVNQGYRSRCRSFCNK